MTTILPSLHQVGERVHVHRKGQTIPGRVSSVHRSEAGSNTSSAPTQPTAGSVEC